MSEASEHGQRVGMLRRASGLTQEALGRAMNEQRGTTWCQTTVCKIENGQRRLWLDEAVTLCKVLGVPLDAIVDDAPTLLNPPSEVIVLRQVRNTLVDVLTQVELIGRHVDA